MTTKATHARLPLLGIVFCTFVAAVQSSNGAAYIPNDPGFGEQWYLLNAGQVIDGVAGNAGADARVAEAWELHRGAHGVRIAIVSSGTTAHAEFADRLLPGRATHGDPLDPFDLRDGCGTGTAVAGIIGAATDNGQGIAGVYSQIEMIPVRVATLCSVSAVSISRGIRWAADQGVDVMVVTAFVNSPSTLLADAVAYAAARDIVLVCATGLSGGFVYYPAAYPECIAVSPTDNRDGFSSNANTGAALDLSAPGWGVYSTSRDGDYSTVSNGWYGAVALVAGTAALMRSYAPQLTAVEIRQILEDTAVDLGPAGWDATFGWGRLDSRAALKSAPLPPLRFELGGAPPALLPPGAAASFDLRIAPGTEAVVGASAMLWYRADAGAFTAQPLTDLGDGNYRVTIPALPCGTVVSYYLSATGDGGTTVTEPVDAPAGVFTAEAVVRQVLFVDDFETDQGWSTVIEGVGTTGAWTRVAPEGTLGAGMVEAQPGYDYSPNEKSRCFVTGQHVNGSPFNSNDVDLGPVRLVSPTIELTTADAEIRYARWFYTNVGTPDELVVEVSRDDGATWAVAEVITHEPSWVQSSFRLSEVSPVGGDLLRVRFTTSDLANDSLTEAAVDEFEVVALSCTAATGDADGDGLIGLGDHPALHGCWSGPADPAFEPACYSLDFDGDGDVDLADFGAFQLVFANSI